MTTLSTLIDQEEMRCIYCKHSYPNQTCLTRHIHQHHPLENCNRNTCWTCNASHSSEEKLKYHFKTVKHLLNQKKILQTNNLPPPKSHQDSPWHELNTNDRYLAYIEPIEGITSPIKYQPRPGPSILRITPINIPLESTEIQEDPRLQQPFSWINLPNVTIGPELQPLTNTLNDSQIETLDITEINTCLNEHPELQDLLDSYEQDANHTDSTSNTTTNIDTFQDHRTHNPNLSFRDLPHRELTPNKSTDSTPNIDVFQDHRNLQPKLSIRDLLQTTILHMNTHPNTSIIAQLNPLEDPLITAANEAQNTPICTSPRDNPSKAPLIRRQIPFKTMKHIPKDTNNDLQSTITSETISEMDIEISTEEIDDYITHLEMQINDSIINPVNPLQTEIQQQIVQQETLEEDKVYLPFDDWLTVDQTGLPDKNFTFPCFEELIDREEED